MGWTVLAMHGRYQIRAVELALVLLAWRLLVVGTVQTNYIGQCLYYNVKDLYNL
jgi:hypothetical protein